MTGTTVQRPPADGGTELPRPHRGARWRWSRPRRALVTGGALAAVLSLSGGAGAGAAATTPGHSGGAHGRPAGGGMARPTVVGKITALTGSDMTVETTAKTAVTVAYSSSTTFRSDPGPRGTTSSASALKTGAFVGVQGTRNSDGSVTASSVTIGRPQQPSKGDGPASGAKPPSGGAPSE
jgi:Domain of unknown function (DUF5666)